MVDRADEVETFSWLAWDDLGVVERLDSEAIATRFFRVIIPVWPAQSFYVTRTADGEEQRIKIALQIRSVILGYLRLPTWLAAIVLGVPAIMLPHTWGWLIVPALLLTIVAALLTFVAGKLNEEEQWRRSLLRRVVGFGAPPEMLAEELRDEVCTNLERMWHARSPFMTWVDAIEHGISSELLVALAEYEQDPSLVRLARANLVNRVWN
ncbi:MAG: hypothetical protein H0T42_10860 [Deltaproteobacteria bacterium]|nr:hypothetical protein [Deltaproteobacteria bacterium]